MLLQCWPSFSTRGADGQIRGFNTNKYGPDPYQNSALMPSRCNDQALANFEQV
jgi:hypothetical protein